MEEIAPKIVAGERRLTLLLMGHWQELRAFKTAVPPDFLADCFTLLPLANERGEIVQVLGGARCKAAAADS